MRFKEIIKAILTIGLPILILWAFIGSLFLDSKFFNWIFSLITILFVFVLVWHSNTKQKNK